MINFKLEKKQLIKILPLLILIATSIISLVIVLSTNVIISQPHFIGLALLLASIIGYFFNIKIGAILSLITVLAGLFTLAAFTTTIVYFSIGSLKMDVFCLGVLIVFIFCYNKEISKTIDFIIKDYNS